MKVEQVMSNTVWTCHAEEPLSCAAKLMWDHDIGAVPVLGADDKLVGIVTDRDLCMAAYFTGERMSSVPVSHAMSKAAFTIGPATRIEAAEDLMRSKQIRRLPVVEAEKLVGMLTLGDLARATKTRGHVAATEITVTLAAILEPRAAELAPLSIRD